MAKMTVQDTSITVLSIDNKDYISLTDIAKYKTDDPNAAIGNWMRNRNTIEYLGIWEALYNPNFKPLEFEGFRKQAGLNAFTMSPKKWIDATDAIKGNLVPEELDQYHRSLIYANEADVLNVALFGVTAKEWRDANHDLKGNIRDYANINQLICLSNMENLNAVFINKGMTQQERLIELNKIAIHQMKVLEGVEERRMLK